MIAKIWVDRKGYGPGEYSYYLRDAGGSLFLMHAAEKALEQLRIKKRIRQGAMNVTLSTTKLKDADVVITNTGDRDVANAYYSIPTVKGITESSVSLCKRGIRNTLNVDSCPHKIYIKIERRDEV